MKLSNPDRIRSMLPPLLGAIIAFALCSWIPTKSTLGQSTPQLEQFKSSIRPLLKNACYDCHSGNEAKGNFQADTLDPNLISGEDIAWWLEVYAVVSKGEMPPTESSELTDDGRAKIVQWLAAEIQLAEQHRKAGGSRSSFRRLTKYEYNYALQDLLGEPWTFDRELQSEMSEDGAFENDAAAMHMSVKQVEAYRKLALTALRRVTVRGSKPAELHWSIPMKAAFDREKKELDRKIAETRKKHKDEPEKLAAAIDKVTADFMANAKQSYYWDSKTGLRADVQWNYRQAKYAFRPSSSATDRDTSGRFFAVVQPGSREGLTVELGDRVPDAGVLRIRVRASRAADANSAPPSLAVVFGYQSTNEGRASQRVSQRDIQIDAAYGDPKVYSWHIPLSEVFFRNTFRSEAKLGQLPNPSEYIRFVNTTVPTGRRSGPDTAILIEHVEVTAPVYSEWPPEAHRRLFASGHEHEAIEEAARARGIISAFLQRAWRSVPAQRDIDRKMRLFNTVRPACDSFEDAVVEVLATVLSSPRFLYVLPSETSQTRGGDDSLSEHTASDSNLLSPSQLATRLSLFLWCSLPDEELLAAAHEGLLQTPDGMNQQVERMLADPRSARFSKHFAQQWLGLQELKFTTPGPGLDEPLLEAMKQEPAKLLSDMLSRNSSILDFIDADYVVVNERLAAHYGIAGVHGNDFRRVTTSRGGSASRFRGGLLTQAGALTMNSDGEDSHPVKRGVWLLTNLLADPPPPPPPAVPEIDLTDPRVAQMTLKERIEDHRNHAACMSCHQKIDPWGIAFENFDAFGRFRQRIDGKQIDASSVLPSSVELDGMLALKQHLATQRRDDFLRATVEKMASFALGRQLEFGDRREITKIVNEVEQSGLGVKSLVHALAASELFRSR